MSILELFRRFVALAVEFVTQRRTWKETGKRHNRSDVQYAEFPRSWSTRAERELQEMDYIFRINRRYSGGRVQIQRSQMPNQWQTPPKLYQLEEASAQRTSRRRVMIISNPDLADDSEGEMEMMMIRK